MTRINFSNFFTQHAKSINILEKYAKPYSSFGKKTNLVKRYLHLKERTEYREKLANEYKVKIEQEKLNLFVIQMLMLTRDDHHDPTKEVAGENLDWASEDNSPPNSSF